MTEGERWSFKLAVRFGCKIFKSVVCYTIVILPTKELLNKSKIPQDSYYAINRWGHCFWRWLSRNVICPESIFINVKTLLFLIILVLKQNPLLIAARDGRKTSLGRKEGSTGAQNMAFLESIVLLLPLFSPFFLIPDQAQKTTGKMAQFAW